MKNLINNYINGNLTTAKTQARRRSFMSILTALQDYGYGQVSALAITAFLKGQGTFQAACDAEHAAQQAVESEVAA